MFVPFSRVEYVGNDPDLPIETNSGHQANRFLAYLLVKGILDLNKPEDLDTIRETFLVADPKSDHIVQKFVAEMEENIGTSEQSFDLQTFPRFDPQVNYV